ncbi:hypothetical protein PLICRDRAFT_54700 [Plicaturopsis crispa FD-325 SS-3]|nr:hypothetical protein PLICRDRAFT_54700 [Plicaturopsis crispa FD-325 SS-3]
MSNGTTPSAIHPKVIPSEVGWQFVPQYYTFVNKEPNRLHCFYTKSSTFIHGTEGEDGKPCHGQLEIHSKIQSIGFEDCKVFIHSVDAQLSANNGIIIQVIGEMSNHGDPWRKFVQTFFLAEQPNGYFVLNDIFRFLKEETVEGDDASETEATAPTVSVPEPAPEPAAPTPAYEPEPEPAPVPEPVEEPPTTVIPEPVAPTPPPEPSPQPNGIHHTEPEPAPPAVEEPPAPVSAPEPTPAPPTPAAAPPPAAPPTTAQPPQQAPPVAAAPAAPKTWANLAATNSKKWGSAVAQESRGTTEVPVASSSPAPSNGPQTPTGPRSAQHGHRETPGIVAAQSVTTAQCFVKGVLEPVTTPALSNTLTARFGPIKEVEIVRSKACAFLEFTTLEAAKKAIIASLPTSQGGEGGIRIDVGGDGPIRITVETRKERGERPVSRPRGGAPVGGETRGGYRGRGGPGGRGRGVPAGGK